MFFGICLNIWSTYPYNPDSVERKRVKVFEGYRMSGGLKDDDRFAVIWKVRIWTFRRQVSRQGDGFRGVAEVRDVDYGAAMTRSGLSDGCNQDDDLIVDHISALLHFSCLSKTLLTIIILNFKWQIFLSHVWQTSEENYFCICFISWLQDHCCKIFEVALSLKNVIFKYLLIHFLRCMFNIDYCTYKFIICLLSWQGSV